MIFLRLFLPLLSSAFILKPTTLIQKMIENSGGGVYQIEQEVQFPSFNPSMQETLTLKETWQIEGENKLRLTVNGTKDLASKIHWVFIYDNGQRFFQGREGRITQSLGDDFIEKYFHFRKADHFQATLVRMKIVPASLFTKKQFKLGKEPDVVSDPHLRLTRIGGVIAYGLGLATDADAEPTPAFYIEQDQFVIRKFRLPSQVEVNAENFSTFTKGLNFPRHRSIRWGDQMDKLVTIQTIRVQSKPEKTLSMTLEPSTSLEVPELGTSKSLVEEFYKRFR